MCIDEVHSNFEILILKKKKEVQAEPILRLQNSDVIKQASQALVILRVQNNDVIRAVLGNK